MKTLKLNAIALGISLVFTGAAIAQSMTKEELKSEKAKIAVTYKAAKAACASLTANAKDICQEEAKGNDKIAYAELAMRNEPTKKHQYDVTMAKAKASYEIAKEKCDDMAGNAQDVCKKEATAADVTAKAEAKVQLKTSTEQTKANEAAAKAQAKANTEKADVRTQATSDMDKAQYMVEKEKCDTRSGTAKDDCITQAKARFHQ